MKKKVLSIIMTFVMFLGIVNWGYPQEFRAADTVAYVYIVSYPEDLGSSGAIGYSGHTFLVVKNLTDDKLTIGHYNLGENHIMSIGTWGNILDGEYAYYNIEKYRMVNDVFSYTPSVYVRAEVTASQINKLSTAINNNYVWTLQKNCARFARYCWNSMFSSSSSYHIDASSTIETPPQMYNKISARDDCRYNFTFGSSRTCVMDNVYVHTASGKKNLSSDAQKSVKGK